MFSCVEDRELTSHLVRRGLATLYRLRTEWQTRKNQPAALKAIEQLIEEYEAKVEPKG
jgi:predicted nuclease with TOPRIM domain